MISLVRHTEKRIRAFRQDMIRRLFSSRRGRKFVLDALGQDVMTVTMDCGDHHVTFSPHELIGRRLFAFGHFERDRVEELIALVEERNLLPPDGATVVEIGANIGTQTIYFCKTGRVKRLLAIEPDPRNLHLLARNVADNDLSQIVSIAPIAVGDGEGTALLHRSSGNHGLSSLFSTVHDLEPVPVRIRPLGPVLAEHGIPEDAVSLIWMDIEGAEPIACRSMTSLLSRRVPLMMEFSPAIYGEQETRDFIVFLAGYYERCIRFFRGERIELQVKDIPAIGKQSDYLFLP